MRRRAASALGLVGVFTAGVAACAGPGVSGDEVTVLAASSLGPVLAQVVQDVEAVNPGAKVHLTVAGSAELATQLVHGAPADVFVAADDVTMRTVLDTGRARSEPVHVATNRLVAVTTIPQVDDVTDLARPHLTLVVCAPQVPCGRSTAALADAFGLELSPVSEESSVTGVLAKVTSGEAEAGVVWATDAIRADDDVFTVELPDVPDARTSYPAVVLSGSELAADVVAHLAGPDGQQVLRDAGFGPPP